MENEQGLSIKPHHILNIMSRRRWYLIVTPIIVMSVGIVLSIVLPRAYSARTLILIQPQKVPNDYVRSLVTEDLDSRINTISQQIMSRSNLERIISEFGLFKEEKRMFMEDKIAELRKRISVDLIRENKRGPADAFAIEFSGNDPKTVMDITNKLATSFIDENLRNREAQAQGTSKFLESELENIRIKLEATEQRLQDYREKNMGGLPEQLESNLRVLDRLQAELTAKQDLYRDAQNRLQTTQTLIGQLKADRSGNILNAEADALTDNERRLQALKAQLVDLESRYTDRHPDVLRTRNSIAELEKTIATEDGTAPGKGGGKDRPLSRLRALALQEAEIQRELSSTRNDIDTVQKKIAYHQQLVEDTPKREQELLGLNRDYENIRETYNSLLARRLEADLAVNMEKEQKGEQFRIIDFAQLPQKPSKPDMKKLFLMVVAAGIGLGAALSAGLEYISGTMPFTTVLEKDTFQGLPVLAVIPRIQTRSEVSRHRLNQAATLVAMGLCGVVFCVFGLLCFAGVEKTLGLVQKMI